MAKTLNRLFKIVSVQIRLYEIEEFNKHCRRYLCIYTFLESSKIMSCQCENV